jgi:valyl-tRNA synthetase
MTPKEKLEKELRRLQRDLNSHRLMTYIPGDTSEEEKARQRERASKLARFREVLTILNG